MLQRFQIFTLLDSFSLANRISCVSAVTNSFFSPCRGQADDYLKGCRLADHVMSTMALIATVSIIYHTSLLMIYISIKMYTKEEVPVNTSVRGHDLSKDTVIG